MQLNVGSLTGSSPKFLLLHLVLITHKNGPHTFVTGTLNTDVHYVYTDYEHTVCEMSKSGRKTELLCIVWELGPIEVQTFNRARGLYNPVARWLNP